MSLVYAIPKGWDHQRFVEMLQAGCEKPLSEGDPIGRCLSIAALILSKCDIDATFHFHGLDCSDYELNQTEESRVAPDVEKRLKEYWPKRALVVLFSDHEEWNWARSGGDHDGYQNQKRRLGAITERTSPLQFKNELIEQAQSKELSLFGIAVQHHSIWTRSPSRVTAERVLNYYQAGNWFNYRSKKVILLELFHPTEDDSPLLVSRECLSPEGTNQLQKPGQNMTSWQRFRSEGERLIIRHWAADPSQEGPLLPVKAIFTIALTDAGSRVKFFDWAETPEVETIPNCPAGLAAFVHWPGLKQSLYGDSWVKDEAYEEALKWTTEKANEAFDLLSQEFEYVWEMMVRDNVKKSYRTEVKARMEQWFGHR